MMFYYFFHPAKFDLRSADVNDFKGPKDLVVEVTWVSLIGSISFIPMTTVRKTYSSRFGIYWKDIDTGEVPPGRFQRNLSGYAIDKWKQMGCKCVK